MLNEIVKGIAVQLNAVFGDGFEIYQNNVEQGLKEPCFFIAVLQPELSPLLGLRALKRNPFDIHYYPADPGDNVEMLDAAERLMTGLEFIELPDGEVLHGTAISYEIIDGVLHFFISFNSVIKRMKELPLMETLETDVNPKKGSYNGS